MSRGTTAVIMAGGKGHRMHPFTNAMPKALLPIGSTILMDVLVSQMHTAGCDGVVVSLGHLAPIIRAYCSAQTFRLPIRFVEETSPLGTAGALGLIDPMPERVIVINCDVLSNVSFGAVIDQHIARKSDLTILGIVHKYKLAYGVLDTDSNGVLNAWREGPEQQYLVSGGAYVVGQRALRLIKRNERLDMPSLVARVMEDGGSAQVYSHDGTWFDLGTIDAYNRGVAEFTADPTRYGVMPAAAPSAPAR